MNMMAYDSNDSMNGARISFVIPFLAYLFLLRMQLILEINIFSFFFDTTVEGTIEMVSYMICYEQIINTVSYHSNLYLQPLNPSIFNLTDRLLGKLELNFTIYYIIHLDFHV